MIISRLERLYDAQKLLGWWFLVRLWSKNEDLWIGWVWKRENARKNKKKNEETNNSSQNSSPCRITFFFPSQFKNLLSKIILYLWFMVGKTQDTTKKRTFFLSKPSKNQLGAHESRIKFGQKSTLQPSSFLFFWQNSKVLLFN